MERLSLQQLSDWMDLVDRLEEVQRREGRRAYIAGPMRDLPYWNVAAFERAEVALLVAGFHPTNPHKIDAQRGLTPTEDGSGGALRDYPIGEDLLHVCTSDVVLVLPGWEYSEGARLEVDVAHRVGVPVYTLLSQRRIEPVSDEGERGAILDCGPKVRFRDEATGGEKEESQARFDLIPPDALTELARVYGMGAEKYSANNYLRGYPWHLSIAALERHVQKFKAGEDIDPESGLHHLAHAAWQAFTLLVFAKRRLGTDDRSPIRRAA